MKEVGFWEYTAPGGGGGLEGYTREDYDQLLDDMAAGGFNSFVLGVKWLTTGYRSRFEWLDQDPRCTAIASDNALIHYALDQARRRGMRTWVLVVASIFQVPQFGIAAPDTPVSTWGEWQFISYDLDQPGLQDRMFALVDEVAELFGAAADGFVIELEFCDGEAKHRIPLYNEWAHRNNRPDFVTIKDIRLEPRSYPFTDWRDFTTSRRIAVCQELERVLRARRFQGSIAQIAELANGPMLVSGNLNLAMLRAGLPGWGLVTYDSVYDRRLNRLATMDFCVHQPRQLGWEVSWLTRGVMTFTWPFDAPPMSLEEQWRMSLEDAAAHQPDRLWFMGADARLAGDVCSHVKLPRWGFPDGRTARRRLLELTAQALHLSR